ncbi:MAG: DNA alkylation repair protein [Pyrinomonadaceae bacterium]
MKLKQALERLRESGTEQNRKIYPRHGVKGEMYGVSFANLGKLQKEIRTDHQLAEGLWASGNHDARILATMIADGGKLTSKELDAWAKDLDNYVIADAFSKMVARSQFVKEKTEKWTASKNEWIGRVGWALIYYLTKDKKLEDAFFEPFLQTIEFEIHQRKNKTRDAMNMALIAIGTRNGFLQKQALMVADKIGKVEVDHGETSCKTPDATEYILKTVERRKGKATG